MTQTHFPLIEHVDLENPVRKMNNL